MTPNMPAIEFLQGFGAGFQYIQAKNKEDEVKEGKNYYMSSFCQGSQVISLGSMAQVVTGAVLQTPPSLVVSIFINAIALLSFPFLFCAAAIKQGDYEKTVASWQDQGYRLAHWLPRNLSERTVRVMSFLAEHTGDIARVAMAAGGIALVCLGLHIWGGTVLATLVYREIDARGYVPRKVRLFIEIYMPVLANLGILLGGGILLAQVFAAGHLLTFSSTISTFLQHNVDRLIRRFVTIDSPSLAAYEGSHVQPSEMNASQIDQILNANENDLEIVPSHCSKPAMDGVPFPESRDFDDFLTEYRRIDWTQKYAAVRAKLRDDERFLQLLKDTFPKEENPKQNIDRLIQILASQTSKSKEAWAAEWAEAQMVLFVDALQGRRRPTGMQADLDASIQHSAKVLPYLKSLRDQEEREYILLKLAIEAGGYCARAFKRAPKEIVDETIVPKGLPASVQQTLDPQRNYEISVLQGLQNDRRRCVEMRYEKIVRKMGIPRTVSGDVHGMDVYRKFLTLGFYPVEKLDRYSFSLLELPSWEIYSIHRKLMHKNYRKNMDKVVAEQGGTNFSVYMNRYINANTRLSGAEKAALIHKWESENNGAWKDRWANYSSRLNKSGVILETTKRFHRILLVKLGILRLKNQAAS